MQHELLASNQLKTYYEQFLGSKNDKNDRKLSNKKIYTERKKEPSYL